MATSAPVSFEFDHDYAKSQDGQLHKEVKDQTKVCTVEFISFWAPAKQIVTNGSLCPLSVCPNIRLSWSAFAGNTCVPWNTGLVNSLQYNCSDTFIFSNVTIQQCTCTHVLVMYMYLKICMEAGKCHLKIPCHVYNQGKRLIHITVHALSNN